MRVRQYNYSSRSQVFAVSTWNFRHKLELNLVIPINILFLSETTLIYLTVLW